MQVEYAERSTETRTTLSLASEMGSLTCREKDLRQRALVLLKTQTFLSALKIDRAAAKQDFQNRLALAQAIIGDPKKVKKPRTLDPFSKLAAEIEEFQFKARQIEQAVVSMVPTFSWESRFPPEIVEKAKLAYAVFKEFNRGPNFGDVAVDLERAAYRVALNCVYDDGRISFLLFSCPTLRAEELLGTAPWFYVAGSAEENTVVTNLDRTRQFLKVLQVFGIETNLVLIFMNTDEEDYIWPIIPPPPLLDSEKLRHQSRLQMTDLGARVKGKISSSFQIVSWKDEILLRGPAQKDLEPARTRIAQNPDEYFNPDEIRQETEFMSRAMANWYRGVFGQLNPEQLGRIVAYKLATYAFQGALLERTFRFGFPILLQNETPSLLRTKMINRLTEESFPALYIYAFGE